MMKNATNNHHNVNKKDSAFQKSRKEKNKSNVNRVNQRFNGSNHKDLRTIKDYDKDGNKAKAKDDFNKIIASSLSRFPPKFFTSPPKTSHPLPYPRQSLQNMPTKL